MASTSSLVWRKINVFLSKITCYFKGNLFFNNRDLDHPRRWRERGRYKTKGLTNKTILVYLRCFVHVCAVLCKTTTWNWMYNSGRKRIHEGEFSSDMNVWMPSKGIYFQKKKDNSRQQIAHTFNDIIFNLLLEYGDLQGYLKGNHVWSV